MNKKANIYVDYDEKIGSADNRLFSSFIEHMGRAVYGGIYDPQNALSDENGFRTDVAEYIKELNVKYLRYPGGNFVSGYDWKNGIGKKENRPLLPDLAWSLMEPNEVGIDEFFAWAEKLGLEPIMAVNLGTGTPQSAFELIQYCNGTQGYWADLRRKNGREKPYGVKYWCLGNEMDGEWQICARTAENYAQIAKMTAKMLKDYDPTIKLIFCGSSSSDMKTFPDWEKTVLYQCYDYVDLVSSHKYFSYDKKSEQAKNEFFGSSDGFDKNIEYLTEIIDEVHKNRLKDFPGTKKRNIGIALDEWNIWYYHEGSDLDKVWVVGAAREENVYTARDAVVFASLINSIVNHCDSIEIACYAQLVNVIAPILTQTGGKAIKQTIFYPLKYAANNLSGDVYKCKTDCGDFKAGKYGKVPSVSVSFVKNENKAYFWVCNLSEETIDASFTAGEKIHFKKAVFMTESDEVNSFEKPFNVVPCETEVKNDKLTLLPRTWYFIEGEVK